MAGNYELWLTSPTGSRLLLLNHNFYLMATRKANAIGKIETHLPYNLDRELLKPDNLLQLWRGPPAAPAKLWRAYFLRRFWVGSSRGSSLVKLWGVCSNDSLRRRIVARYPGSAEATLTDYADDMMKTIVTNAVADGTNPAPTVGTRQWAYFSVEGDLSKGPTLTLEVPWERLMSGASGGILPKIAAAAAAEGTPVWFDVEPVASGTSGISFVFRTRTGQPGQDVTETVLFDEHLGTMDDSYWEEDYSQEENYIYAIGQGEEEDTEVQQVSDPARYLASPWNRCEGTVNAGGQEESDGVREVGRDYLEKHRPLLKAGGNLTDTSRARFQRDWDHGDKVRIRAHGREYDAYVLNTTITIRRGKETIQGKVEYEG